MTQNVTLNIIPNQNHFTYLIPIYRVSQIILFFYENTKKQLWIDISNWAWCTLFLHVIELHCCPKPTKNTLMSLTMFLHYHKYNPTYTILLLWTITRNVHSYFQQKEISFCLSSVCWKLQCLSVIGNDWEQEMTAKLICMCLTNTWSWKFGDEEERNKCSWRVNR